MSFASRKYLKDKTDKVRINSSYEKVEAQHEDINYPALIIRVPEREFKNTKKAREQVQSKEKREHLLKIESQTIQRNKMENMEIQKSINEKLEKLKLIRCKLKKNDITAAIIGLTGFLIAITEDEIYTREYTNKKKYESDTTCTILRFIVEWLTIVLVILIVRHSILLFRFSREGSKLIESKFHRTKIFKMMWVEIFINLIHSPPYWDCNFEVNSLNEHYIYSLNTLLTVSMSMRIYLLFRLVTFFSKWRNEDAEHFCELQGCEANTIFALKALYKQNPYWILTIICVFGTALFGYALEVFERMIYPDELPENEEDLANYSDYRHLYNGMWVVILIMSTVGYGDYYMKTHSGRVVVIFTCIWGSFVFSLMVVTMSLTSEFTSYERQSYDIIKRFKVRTQIKKLQRQLILQAGVVAVTRKKVNHDEKEKNELAEEERIFHRILLKIKIERKKLRKTKDVPLEEFIRQLSGWLDKDFNHIKQQLTTVDSLQKKILVMKKGVKYMKRKVNQIHKNFANLDHTLTKISGWEQLNYRNENEKKIQQKQQLLRKLSFVLSPQRSQPRFSIFSPLPTDIEEVSEDDDEKFSEEQSNLSFLTPNLKVEDEFLSKVKKSQFLPESSESDPFRELDSEFADTENLSVNLLKPGSPFSSKNEDNLLTLRNMNLFEKNNRNELSELEALEKALALPNEKPRPSKIFDQIKSKLDSRQGSEKTLKLQKYSFDFRRMESPTRKKRQNEKSKFGNSPNKKEKKEKPQIKYLENAVTNVNRKQSFFILEKQDSIKKHKI